MKQIMTIRVTTLEPQIVSGSDTRVVMIPFSAEANGSYFSGRTVYNGVDTQFIASDGSFSLSARYMLEGRDLNGTPCRLFIENKGTSLEKCVPRIITDDPELRFLETAQLTSSIENIKGGVIVRIFAEDIR